MQDAQNISAEQTHQGANTYVPLPLRNDTMLGVCEGLSEDLGINANLLRVLFGGMVFFNISLAIGTYLMMGLVLAASRYLFPKQVHVARSVTAEFAKPANTETELQIAA